jgi:hypothetical protein
MTIQLLRIITVSGSVLISTVLLAAPKPFDTELTTFGPEEEVVTHYISSCSPVTTPGLRLCQEKELDLNGDSRTDMIVGVNQNSSDPNDTGKTKRLYIGRGEGLFNSAVYFGPPNMPTSSLRIADLDNDGDLDMVETVRGDGTSGGTSDVNTIYVNRTGTLQSLLEDDQPLDTTHYRSSTAAVGDVNNDGKLDIVVANETPGTQSNPAGETLPYTHTNYVYLNQTTTANNVVFGAAIPIDPPGSELYTRRILLIDAEGDGDLDLVATGATNHLDPSGKGNWLYINRTIGGPAGGASPFAPAVALNADPADDTDVANSIAAGDLDGDSDPDLVFGTWSRMNAAVAEKAPDRYYLNNSTPAGPNFETTGTFGPPVHTTNVRLGDFDNDTDLDALVVSFEDGLNRLHRNLTGSGQATLFDAGVTLAVPAPLTADRSRGLDTADLNKDGSLDVVIVNRDQVGLRYLNNDTCSGTGNTCNPFLNDAPNIPAQVPATGRVVAPGVPIDIDDHLYRLTVEDSDNAYPADFTARVPTPPASAPYTCTAGTSGEFCAGGQITPTNPAFSGALQPIEVRVHDGEDISNSFTTFSVTIGAAGNGPPTFTAPPAQTATVGTAFSLDLAPSASDPNSDPLTFSATGLPAGLAITAAGLVSGTPTDSVGSPFTVAIAVDDGKGGAANGSFQITVQPAAGPPPAANQNPTITPPGPQTATVGTAFNLTVTASDPDSDPLTFSATGLPPELTVSEAGVISGTPTSTAGSPFTVAVTVNDGKGGAAEASFSLTVNAAAAVTPPPTPAPPAAPPSGGGDGGGGSVGLADLLAMLSIGALAALRRRRQSKSDVVSSASRASGAPATPL